MRQYPAEWASISSTWTDSESTALQLTSLPGISLDTKLTELSGSSISLDTKFSVRQNLADRLATPVVCHAHSFFRLVGAAGAWCLRAGIIDDGRVYVLTFLSAHG